MRNQTQQDIRFEKSVVETHALLSLFDDMSCAAILVDTQKNEVLAANRQASTEFRYDQKAMPGLKLSVLQPDPVNAARRFVTRDHQTLMYDVHIMQLTVPEAEISLLLLRTVSLPSFESDRLNLALQSAKFGVWEVILPERTLVWDSVCGSIFGLEPSQYPRNRSEFLTRVFPEDRTDVEQAARHTFEHGVDYHQEFRIVLPGGEVRWHAAFGRRICDSNGVATRIIGVCTDCTDARSIQQQSIHSQKMESLGRLASGISHEFNNLMTIVCGYTEIILRSLPRESDIRVPTRRIRQAALDASQLTSKLLSFSRQEPTKKSSYNLVRIVGRMQEVLRRFVDRKYSISTNANCEFATVYIDILQIKQVILNLVLNARDAMPAGGEIQIHVDHQELNYGATELAKGGMPGKYALLSVIDSGCGVPEEIQSRIFDPFFTTKETGKGTGLGLAIVHSIVQDNSGFISLSSVPDRGSRFNVYFPLSEVPEDPIRN